MMRERNGYWRCAVVVFWMCGGRWWWLNATMDVAEKEEFIVNTSATRKPR
jgi:hypothetical protein